MTTRVAPGGQVRVYVREATMTPVYDVFVSHHGLDKPIVERLCWSLLDAGVRPWFDKWDLAPGDLWIREIERVLATVPAVLVCLGAHGWSAWGEAEREAAVQRTTSGGSVVVVPLLLPGAPEHGELPVFVRGRVAVDLRDESRREAELARLIVRLTGREPGPGRTSDERRDRPYRGLQSFTEADAGWMFGREREEAKLLDALRAGHRFVTVVGASGSGKSSLVRAGVVPAVRTGGVDGRATWQVLVMRPGSRPCHSLALRLLALQRSLDGRPTDLARDDEALASLERRLAGADDALANAADLLLDRDEQDQQLLIVVDQFEELFTAVTPIGESRLSADGGALLRNLLAASTVEGGRVRVLIAIRADFTGECLAVPELGRRMERVHFALPPMTAEQLREAIRRPALRVGYDVEKTLEDVLVAATAEQGGRLPLLQYTLDLLWDVRDRDARRITHAAYHECVGTMEESVARRTEEVFATLVKDSPNREDVVRRVLLRLIRPGEGTGDTRRQMPRRELAGDPDSDTVLDAFIRARILVTDASPDDAGKTAHFVEIAHEALLSRWGRLRGWINENRDALRTRLEVNHAAREWERRGRAADDLWRGGQLVRALELLTKGDIDVSREERQFIHASRSAERRRTRLIFGGITLAFVTLLATLAVAVDQYVKNAELAREYAEMAQKEAEAAQKAREQAIAARDHSRMAAIREAAGDATMQTILARELERPGDVHGWLVLASTLIQTPVAQAVFEHDRPLVAATFTPDENVLTMRSNGKATKWSPDGSSETVGLRPDDMVVSASFSPDAESVLFGLDHMVVAKRYRVSGGGDPLVYGDCLRPNQCHNTTLKSVTFSPDGQHVMTTSGDRTARVWRSDGSGEPLVLQGHSDEVLSGAFSKHGRIATGSKDGTVRVWQMGDPSEPVVLTPEIGSIQALAFRHDGRSLVMGSSTGNVDEWTVDGGEKIYYYDKRESAITQIVFSPDGTRVLISAEDGTVKVRLPGPMESWEMPGHQEAVVSGTFSPDGDLLVTASRDKTARVWRSDGGKLPRMIFGIDYPLMAGVRSPDGKRLATISGSNRTLALGDSDGRNQLILDSGAQVRSVSFSPDGEKLLTVSPDSPRVWSAKHEDEPIVFRRHKGKGEPIVFRGHEGLVEAASFSADGSRVLAVTRAREKGSVFVWRADGAGEPVALHGHDGPIHRASFSPDGLRILTASEDRTARVWQADGAGAPVVLRGHQGGITAASFSPDGQWVVTGSQDFSVRLWRADGSAEPVVLVTHDAIVRDVSFSPDGRSVLTASEDTTARIRSIDGSGEQVVLRGQAGGVLAATFSPDGKSVLTTARDNAAQLWRADGVGEPLVFRKFRVTSASFSPDGNEIMVVGDRLYFWPASPEEHVRALWRATPYCLPVEQRMTRLGESRDEATSNHDTCKAEVARHASE